MKILVLNCGSSSLKCELFDTSNGEPVSKWQAQADWKELPGLASLRIESGAGTSEKREENLESLSHTVEHLLDGLVNGAHAVIRGFDEINITGHRVVHGGERFRQTMRLTPEVRQGIIELAPFAPLHNPLALEAIDGAQAVLGANSAHAVVFDTSFHSTLPPESFLYPGPRSWADKALRRYGFHGISHQYLSRKAAGMLGPSLKKPAAALRLITCHLGNGCSLCAIKGGVSVETTMGFTPLEGLVMGSRSGTVDPGLVLYLLQHDGHSAAEVDRILNHESGLLGLSGISSDMRQIAEAAANGHANAKQALEVFVYRLAYFISALLPSLGGLDGLIFAGGIGENSAPVRARVCERLAYLGVSADPAANAATKEDTVISPPGAAPVAAVIHTRENDEIARECLKLVRDAGTSS